MWKRQRRVQTEIKQIGDDNRKATKRTQKPRREKKRVKMTIVTPTERGEVVKSMEHTHACTHNYRVPYNI